MNTNGNTELNEQMKTFITYFQIIWGHSRRAAEWFQSWEQFMTYVCTNLDIANQCPSFIGFTSESYLESAFMSVARLYDTFDSKHAESRGKGYSLYGLSKELDGILSYINVNTVTYKWYNPNVITYIRDKWIKDIIQDYDTSIDLQLSVYDIPKFIRDVSNSMKGRYKDFFNLRNQYYAHNNYTFGQSLLENYKPVKEEILSQYEELLQICIECLKMVSKIFYEGKSLCIIPENRNNLGDISFLFSAAREYVNNLECIKEQEKECIHCHKKYIQKLYQQVPGYESINQDICPYCLKSNGKLKKVISLNNKTEPIVEVIVAAAKENHLITEKN